MAASGELRLALDTVGPHKMTGLFLSVLTLACHD
jgi:hypothetical protein